MVAIFLLVGSNACRDLAIVLMSNYNISLPGSQDLLDISLLKSVATSVGGILFHNTTGCGGRLTKADILYSMKQSILLSKQHRFAIFGH